MINGAVVGRNTGRGTALYDLEPFVEKHIALGRNADAMHVNLRAEAFNLLNHRTGN